MKTSITVTTTYRTAQDAADELGVTDGWIRQICATHANIGQKFGRVWMLSDQDIDAIKNLDGFRGKSSDQT